MSQSAHHERAHLSGFCGESACGHALSRVVTGRSARNEEGATRAKRPPNVLVWLAKRRGTS